MNNSDALGVVRKSVVPEAQAVRAELQSFHLAHKQEVPPAAAAALERFLAQQWGSFTGHPDVDVQPVVAFSVFRSEFEFLMQDRELEARNLTELAFEHLQRVLVVDSSARGRWVDAFDRREDHCERLGAVHLLSHGIWAFKVAAAGAATDLVYGEPIQNEMPIVRRTARALVLTEWKVVKNPADLNTKAAEARSQTSAYASGILGDLELRTTRYIVLVSRKSLPVPADQLVSDTMFRHIVVAVDPDTPSVQAAANPS